MEENVSEHTKIKERNEDENNVIKEEDSKEEKNKVINEEREEEISEDEEENFKINNTIENVEQNEDINNTNDYIFRCEICHLIPVIKIDHQTFKINCKCENNHIKTDINIFKALEEYKNFSIKTCSLCEERSEEDNYICIQCQKIFCLDGGCKKKHIKENPSHKLIEVNKYDTLCLEHYTSISKYCKDCKKNICIKCQRAQHGGHKLIDLGEILPITEEFEQGEKIFEEKKEKLLELKKNINIWLEEFNSKVSNLLNSLDTEILLNELILKKYRADLMNYQMIENYNYFSSKKAAEIYSNSELMSFVKDQDWLAKTFFITQILNKMEQPINIKDENEEQKENENEKNNNKINDTKTDAKKINDDENKINRRKTALSLKPQFSINEKEQKKEKEKEKLNPLNPLNLLKTIKTFSAPIPQVNNEEINKEVYWSLNEIKNKDISNKVFKSSVNIPEKIYSGIIDNKGIIFLGGDSCLNIYRFEQKTFKIEKEFTIKGLGGAVNTICEIKDDFLIIGTSNDVIKIIEFLGNKKYRIHQEIRSQDKYSIYKIIETSDYHLISCDENNLTLFMPIKNNFYEISQELKLGTPTCCVMEISENIIATSHIVLNKICIYEINKNKLISIKEIENVEASLASNSIAMINENYFCSIGKQNLYIISSKNYSVEKKIEIKMDISQIFPVNGMIILSSSKKNEKGKIDYSLCLKEFDEKNKDLLYDCDQSIINKNGEEVDDMFYLNFFNPSYMVIASKSSLSIWG